MFSRWGRGDVYAPEHRAGLYELGRCADSVGVLVGYAVRLFATSLAEPRMQEATWRGEMRARASFRRRDFDFATSSTCEELVADDATSASVLFDGSFDSEVAFGERGERRGEERGPSVSSCAP